MLLTPGCIAPAMARNLLPLLMTSKHATSYRAAEETLPDPCVSSPNSLPGQFHMVTADWQSPSHMALSGKAGWEM